MTCSPNAASVPLHCRAPYLHMLSIFNAVGHDWQSGYCSTLCTYLPASQCQLVRRPVLQVELNLQRVSHTTLSNMSRFDDASMPYVQHSTVQSMYVSCLLMYWIEVFHGYWMTHWVCFNVVQKPFPHMSVLEFCLRSKHIHDFYLYQQCCGRFLPVLVFMHLWYRHNARSWAQIGRKFGLISSGSRSVFSNMTAPHVWLGFGP